jgi:hypothetical protein
MVRKSQFSNIMLIDFLLSDQINQSYHLETASTLNLTSCLNDAYSLKSTEIAADTFHRLSAAKPLKICKSILVREMRNI